MNLAYPLALAWLALAVPIVIFYILKIRLRRVPVTTTLFWSQIYEERRPRSLWQQLRHLLSLLVQLLFLLLVALALTDPFWFWEKLQAQRVVLIVDNSASMKATDGLPTRLDAAREHGFRMIRSLRARDEMAILSAASAPQVTSGLTSHQRTLRDALETIAASDGPTRVAEAVELARRLLANHPHGRIVVLSDGRFPQREKLAAAEGVELIAVGSPAANVGITQFQVRRSLVDTIGYQILLVVQNFSAEPLECRLEIDLEQDVVDVLPLKLAPGETFSRTLDHVSASGGRLVARLQHSDALVADNQAVALLPRREVQKVLLVTQGSHYLQRVLEAMPAVELQVASVSPESIPAGTIVVYHRQAPAKLPRGRLLVIDPSSSSDAWTVGEELANPLVGKQQTTSPLLTHVRMDNVWMPAARKLEFKRAPEALISAVTGEILYGALENKDGADQPEKLLVLTVDLEKGDLPLRTAFPILMTNALSWFQGRRGELREALAAGSMYEVDLSEQHARMATTPTTSDGVAAAPERLTLRSPSGRELPLPAGQQKFTIGPLDECGVWSIATTGSNASPGQPPQPPIVELAVNLASEAESNVHVEDAAPVAQLDLAGIASRPIWFYLIVLATSLICLEWWLYQRRWIS